MLKDLPASTAPLHQAYRYQKDAATVGFDWPDIDGVWAKLQEELAELDEAAATGDPAAIEHEVGDVLFAVVNLARRLDVQPDVALRQANQRFAARFQPVEAAVPRRGASTWAPPRSTSSRPPGRRPSAAWPGKRCGVGRESEVLPRMSSGWTAE